MRIGAPSGKRQRAGRDSTASLKLDAPASREPDASKRAGPGAGAATSASPKKIWPGQGALIENTFRLQMVDAMKTLDPDFSPTGITVTYRASAHKPDAHPKEAAVADKPSPAHP